MRKRILPIAAMPLLLAAGQDAPMLAGKWENRVEILDVLMPNPPVGLVESMKGRPSTATVCLSPADAKLGPRGILRADSGCTFSRFDTAGGRIATRMLCNRPTGRSLIESSGSYTPSNYSVTGRSTLAGSNMTIVTRTTGRLVGGC